MSFAAARAERKTLNILVTAGPTREPIDPVRFISNYSTGFFGCRIAQEAKRRGHRVILISGPMLCARPKGIRLIRIETARQMQRELQKRFSWCNCLIMTAAISDFRPKKLAGKKLKRGRGKKVKLVLELVQNPDILADLGLDKGGRTLVGIALETENLGQNAETKLREKNLDLIVATQMKANSYPFGKMRLDALIMDRNGQVQKIKGTKSGLSRILLDNIEKIVL